jgi:activator of HSP90 ATPase
MDGSDVTGDIVFPEFSHDTPVDQLECTVSSSSSSAAKQLVQSTGVPIVREKLREFLAALAARMLTHCTERANCALAVACKQHITII